MTPRCRLCQRASALISQTLGICASCLQSRPEESREHLARVHAETRSVFGLPAAPPREPGGVRCSLCANECVIGEGTRGYCGLRSAHNGRLVHLAGAPRRGLMHWYRDPLPTNCVADWVCEGHNRSGDHNLAVFYASCTANCLFCLNWHYRQAVPTLDRGISAEALATVANERTFCVCFFGGDPSSQMPHALAAARALARRGVRICWETNGTMHPRLLDAALQISLGTGGCVKFDLKAFDDGLHRALTGISNRRTLDNFARAAAHFRERPVPPPVIASILLVPGYVEADEVGRIAHFIASLEPRLPCSLLAFAPGFYMADLPCTSTRHALEAESAARSAGLSKIRIGNRHLLDVGIP